MKGTRALIMLLLSVIAGVAAMVLAAQWINQQRTASSAGQVVVASRDIDLGQPLNASMVTPIPWPAGSMPTGSFPKVEALEGRVLRTPMLKGEPVLEGKLAPIGTKGGLSAVIGQGRRAITVKVNEVVGVAGFALPGNYVDVLVNTQDERDRPVSKIVLERILVLAVAQEATRDDTKPRVVNAVTLEVTPEEAERIDLARSVGNLSLVLRNQIDQNQARTEGIRKSDLLGEATFTPPPSQVAAAAPAPAATKPAPRRVVRREPTPAPAAPPAKDEARVEVIRGVQRSSVGL
ncbi:MAG: Flp pilus assembly protein CpaB [Burkholderiaceae bacterium]|nr:Flp pilus assembly protein CpaB [Burkholderiaceae bacterium]